MAMKLFYLLVVVTVFTVTLYVYSVNEQSQIVLRNNRNLSNVTETPKAKETHRPAHERSPCDCCGNQSDSNDELLRIPKRLHQTYKTDQIPEQYFPLILSWIQKHPDWEYYFWSDKDAECLINDFYPQYVDLYSKYKHKLQKSDAIRYFILHRYGGVYADMDMLSLRPMEEFLRTNTCVLTPEPFLQTKLLFNQPSLITNCIMASTACHPFLNYAMEALRTSYRGIKSIHDILLSTGPIFLNATYYNYLKTYFRDSKQTQSNVYIADYKYMVPRYDKRFSTDIKFVRYCNGGKTTSPLHKEACDELVKTKYTNVLPQEAYTDHLWLHLGYDERNAHATQPIKAVVAKVKRYGFCDLR